MKHTRIIFLLAWMVGRLRSKASRAFGIAHRGLAHSLKSQRLEKYGFTAGDKLPIAHLRFRIHCCDVACAPAIAANIQSLRDYAKLEHEGGIADFFKLTATVSDLNDFSGCSEYRRAVSKETQGKYPRSTNKARRLGYFSRKLGLNAYASGLRNIRRSKLIRSRGLVMEALLGSSEQIVDVRTEFEASPCMEHWRMEWGVFKQTEPDQLKAFALLQRTGNFINVKHFIGHAEALNDGVMKILNDDIMEWLLAREDAHVQNVRYLVHGALEEGTAGLADWRRYVRLIPRRLEFDEADPNGVLAEFDPRTYLRLNPDVRVAGVNAREHYLWHGIYEGRKTKDPSNDEIHDAT